MMFDYDTIPVGYYDQIYTVERGVQSKWHHLKFDLFRTSMKGFHRHLDVGCGAGTFIGSLSPSDHDSLGIDIAQSQIAYANQHYGGRNHRFEAIPVGRLPFADSSFDVVTTIELIEHLSEKDVQLLLSECFRVLRPGGRLLVSTPNYNSLWPVVEKIVNRRGKIDYSKQHINHYGRRRLRSAMTQVGATNVAVQGYMLFAPFAAAISWALSDTVFRHEPGWLVDRFGLLLFASGTKP